MISDREHFARFWCRNRKLERAVSTATYDKNSMGRPDDFRYLASTAGWIIDRSLSLSFTHCYYMKAPARAACGSALYLHEVYVITPVASRSEI